MEPAPERWAREIEDAMTTRMLPALCVAIIGWTLAMGGCTISKQGSGDDKKVSIEAPGASIQVDKSKKANDSGIPLYPGAQEKLSHGDEGNRAHVNLSMPFLKLKVVKMKFTSDDATDKVLAFYREKLASYGTVLECKGGGQDVEVGSGRGLDSPVKCDKISGARDQLTLKVGTEGNQHVVQVKPNGKGSEFSLIFIQINGKGEDDYSGKQPS
jgi:hypothetical protein